MQQCRTQQQQQKKKHQLLASVHPLVGACCLLQRHPLARSCLRIVMLQLQQLQHQQCKGLLVAGFYSTMGRPDLCRIT